MTFHNPSLPDIASLIALKKNSQISVCIPCQNEEATIGELVEKIKTNNLHGLVDEILVVDDRSTDQTSLFAKNAGAKVVSVDSNLSSLAPGHGKGNALWTSLLASQGDLIVWCDGDVTNFSFDWILQLVFPLLSDPQISLVKGFYDRPMDLASGKGGGRTTELVARPLLSFLYPELSFLRQPLSGEVAGRRCHLEKLSLIQGWGVDVALLIDTMRLYGAQSIAQVDLGTRHHKHRPLEELSLQAAEIMWTLLARSQQITLRDIDPLLRKPDGSQTALNTDSRPPLVSMKEKK